MDNLTIREGFVGQRMIVFPTPIKKVLTENSITKNFYVTDLGYYPKADHHKRERYKGAKEYIFIYCTEGEGWLIFNKKKIVIKPHHFFIIPKSIRHSYGANNDNPWSIYWMHFDGTIVPQLFERFNVNDCVHDSILFNSQIVKLFDQIYTIFNSGFLEHKLEYANILSQRFISTFIYRDIYKVSNSVNSENLINSIKDYLFEHIHEQLKTEELVSKYNYSASYILSLFKKSTGYSLHHFFNLKKTQKACEYMNYTNKSIKEISFLLGYQDQFYFSRVFKKHMGISPKEYRKNI